MISWSNKKYFILDLDGTLYKGNKPFAYTKKFLSRLRKTGRKPIFLTNNSSKSTSEYATKLNKLGFNANNGEIYNSGKATIEYLSQKRIKNIYLLAPPGVEKEFRQAGFKLTTKPKAVVLALDTTFTYQKFCIAHDLIKAGVPFYATHPDIHLPLEKGFHPDIGALIAAFQASTGKKPYIIGKPSKHIYSQLRKHLGCPKKEMIVIGDRLYTDIKGAHDYGIDSVLVLSGETTRAMAAKSKLKPDKIIQNIGKITSYL